MIASSDVASRVDVATSPQSARGRGRTAPRRRCRAGRRRPPATRRPDDAEHHRAPAARPRSPRADGEQQAGRGPGTRCWSHVPASTPPTAGTPISSALSSARSRRPRGRHRREAPTPRSPPGRPGRLALAVAEPQDEQRHDDRCPPPTPNSPLKRPARSNRSPRAARSCAAAAMLALLRSGVRATRALDDALAPLRAPTATSRGAARRGRHARADRPRRGRHRRPEPADAAGRGATRYGFVGCVSGRRATVPRSSLGSITYVGNHGDRDAAARCREPRSSRGGQPLDATGARLADRRGERAHPRRRARRGQGPIRAAAGPAPDEATAEAVVHELAGRPSTRASHRAEAGASPRGAPGRPSTRTVACGGCCADVDVNGGDLRRDD